MTPPAPKINNASRSPRALSVAALLTACAILPLVFVGAGVTSTDSGMAYEDWPTSAGHLVNPPSWWQSDNTRWEHGHRLLGWTVGMLAIVVAVLSWPSGGIVRLGGVCLLAAIIIQGVLGGLRVQEVSTPLSTRHFANYERGEIYGLAHSPERFAARWLRPRTPIRGLWLTGQDVATCGVAGAMAAGYLTASAMLRRNLLKAAGSGAQ